MALYDNHSNGKQANGAGPSSSSRLPRLLATPLSRAVVAFLALLSLAWTYGHFRFYRDPLSVFFSDAHGYDRFYSNVREEQANSLVDKYTQTEDPTWYAPPKAGPQPEMCATFVTVGRRGLTKQYLETSVSSLVHGLTQQERNAIKVKIFFADPDPRAHPSYNSFVFDATADELVTYPKAFSVDDLNYITDLAAQYPAREAVEKKSILDYSRALQHCLNTTDSPYIAIFEDDVLFADGWLARTLLNLRKIQAMMAEPTRRSPEPGAVEPGTPNSWLYLRLFNQERSTGWTGGSGFFSNNVHYISAAVALPLIVVLLCLRRAARRAPLGRALDLPTVAFIALVAVPCFIWLFFAAGKASMLPPPEGVREEFFGCCSQALVYNRAHAADLAEFMLASARTRNGGRGDMLSKEFAWERGLARMSAYPMLVQHLGAKSVTGTTDDEARRIWSMAFESLSQSRLASDHDRLVEELFPGSSQEDRIS